MNTPDSSPGRFIDFSLGLDDTDSLDGMCTTYLGTKLYFHLLDAKPLIQITEFPYLIRHNPNVPNRTKGNGSIVIKGKISPGMISWFETTVLNLFYKFSHIQDPNSNPGLVVWYGPITKELEEFSTSALWDIIEISELNPFLNLNNVFFHFPKEKNGLIGSLAGIGTNLDLQDHTYELLVYRNPPYIKKRIGVNIDKILEVDEDKLNVFNCVDGQLSPMSIKIIPKGLDPVFCGIRGETPEDILNYWNDIQPQPSFEFLLIFKTNQGTDAHLNATPISSTLHPKFSAYKVVNMQGSVFSNPQMAIGGHVNFDFCDTEGQIIKCFAYEPTKHFRTIVMKLIKGDVVKIGGNVRQSTPQFPKTINIEKLKIVSLATKETDMNPICPKCRKRMKSAGKHQPFRCKKCKILFDKKDSKIKQEIKRDLKEKIYLPTIDAQRHLSKPYKRIFRREKDDYKVINIPNIQFWLKKINGYNKSMKRSKLKDEALHQGKKY